jgi:hypothetical protein
VTDAQRQFGVLVRNQLRLDFRSRGPHGALRQGTTLGIALLVFGTLGFTFWSIASRAQLSLEGAAGLVYVLGGLVVLMQTVQMHGDLLFSPQDGEVLYWRPIESRTLFAARVAHALFYVSFVVTPAALFCAVAYSWRAPSSFAVFASFIAGAWLASLFFTSCALLLQGFLLRYAHGERFQHVVSVAQMLTLAATVTAYQLLPSLVLAVAKGERHPAVRLWRWLPSASFAAIPALVAGAPAAASRVAPLCAGSLALVAVATLALRRLGPRYVDDLSRAQSAHAESVDRRGFLARADAWVAERLGAKPLCRCGYEFVLAQFAGDRRVRIQLLTVVGVPLGLVAAALVGTRGFDPYRAGAPAGSGPMGEWATRQGLPILYYASYFYAYLLATSTRMLHESVAWKASWVFWGVPIRRYDHFFAGAVAGVAARTLIPASLVHAVVLCALWRDPLHVVAHLALPIAVAAVALPLVQLIEVRPLFAREPNPGLRVSNLTVAMAAGVPVAVVGFAHYSMRGHPVLLVVIALVVAGLAPLAWWPLARRLRNVFRDAVFAA